MTLILFISNSFFSRLVGSAILLLLLLSSPAFAGISTDAPPRVDPFYGILDKQQLQPGDPQFLSRSRSLNVAVLLSENTKKHLAWCQAQTKGRDGVDRAMGSFFAGAKAMADSDRLHMLAYSPKFVTDGVTMPLVQRFASLKVLNSLEEFRQGGFDLLALVDVSFVNTFNDQLIIFTKYETGTFINVYFIDPQNALVGKVETGEIQASDREIFLQQVGQLRQATLERYQAGLQAILGPLPAVAIAAPPELPKAEKPAMSVKERLKELDNLVKQNLITPKEAKVKRAEILKGL